MSSGSHFGCMAQGRVQTEQLLQECCTTVGQLARSSLGPNGRSKLLRASETAGAGVITSISSRLFQGIAFPSHLQRLLVQQTALAQHARYGDCGLLCAWLASELLAHGLDASGGSHAARMAVARGYQAALEHVVCLLGQRLSGGSSSSGGVDGGSSGSGSSSDEGDSESDSGDGSESESESEGVGGGCIDDASCRTTGGVTDYGGSCAERHGRHHRRSACQHSQHQHHVQAASAAPTSAAASAAAASTSAGADAACDDDDDDEAVAPNFRLCLELQSAGVSSYMALVRSVMAPKQMTCLSSSELQRTCVLVVQAFLSALPDQAPGDASSGNLSAQPHVRVVAVPALDAAESCVEAGVLLDQPIRAAVASRLPKHDAVVALFDVPLDVTRPHPDAPNQGEAAGGAGTFAGAEVVAESAPGQGWSPQSAEVSALLDLIGALKELGADVVATQKTMHDQVVHAVLDHGMVPLQRLSVLHIHSVARATGAVPISSLRAAGTPAGAASLRHMFGVAGSISKRQLGHKTYLHISPPPHGSSLGHSGFGSSSAAAARAATAATAAQRRAPVRTLVLGASCETAADELRAAAESALKVLTWSMQAPYALPGGGCAEMLMAASVRRHARDMRQRGAHVLQVQAMHAMASALQHAATALVQPLLPKDSQHKAVEAWHSACAHVCRAANAASGGSSQCGNATVDFIGWDAGVQQFVAVASAQSRPQPAQHCYSRRSSSQGEAGEKNASMGSQARQNQGGGEGSSSGGAGGGSMEVQHESRAGQHVTRDFKHGPGAVMSAHLLDSLAAKLSAMCLAVECACLLLRVDGTLSPQA